MKQFLDNKWLVSLSAGIMLGLSYSPVNFSILTIPAFILLFHLVEQCKSNRQLAYYSYVAFLVWNIIGSYWLTLADVLAGVSAILANSVLMTIPLVIIRVFFIRFKSKLLVSFLAAATWVSYEFLHHNWDLAWPWLSIANAWAFYTPVIQYISFTGHLGITFWVILSASLAYFYWKNPSLSLKISLLITLLAPTSFSMAYYFYPTMDENYQLTEVAVIQPNHDSYLDFGGMSGVTEVLDSLFSISNRVKTEKTDLVIWPENAIDKAIFLNSLEAFRIADSAKVWDTNIITGTGLYVLYEEEPELFRGIFNGQPYNVYNSALLTYANGEQDYYNKGKLVPIVERFPFVQFFSRIDIYGWFDWGDIAGYGKGTDPKLLDTNRFKTTALICYDSVYPTWAREFVLEGADFITIITNDGWWGNTSGHYQHFEYAKLRAIEFDRWVVRSANNGFSGIITSKGKVIQKTNYWERTGFTATVPSKSTLTLYARFGDWLSYLSLAITFLFLTLAFIKKRINSSENE